MSTTFKDKDGTEVAHRFFGGETEGVKVELRPGAADISHNTRLFGDDGSHETLETLAQSIGNGRARDWAVKLAEKAVNDREPRSMGGAMARGVPVTIVQQPSTAGIEDALNRIAEELHLLNLANDERS